ncbi:MAG: dicarboxylate/amino acid:cation symporter [Rhabdochlamydiaceae bacterium]
MNAFKPYMTFLIAIMLGIFTGWIDNTYVHQIAHITRQLFTNFLQLLASPIVFFAIISTLGNMKAIEEMKNLGKKIFGYTILTTLIASFVALILFVILDPADQNISLSSIHSSEDSPSYLSFFLQIIPSNLIKAFLENNVIGLSFIALIFGLAILKSSQEDRNVLGPLFSAIFKMILNVTNLVMKIIPLGIWGFTDLLIQELRENSHQISELFLYLSCVIGANFIQGFIVLPLLLKWKKISPLQTFKGVYKALVLAFFSKSSNVTLPISLKCAEENLKIRPKIAKFSLPLCTVINMNGCAAFILSTVLFVSCSEGLSFSFFHLILWVFLATLAAIGNAGVPMGCFFLSSTFLVGLGVPLKTLGLILPFYTILDMIETALNVWSDLCVTAIIDKTTKE